MPCDDDNNNNNNRNHKIERHKKAETRWQRQRRYCKWAWEQLWFLYVYGKSIQAIGAMWECVSAPHKPRTAFKLYARARAEIDIKDDDGNQHTHTHIWLSIESNLCCVVWCAAKEPPSGSEFIQFMFSILFCIFEITRLPCFVKRSMWVCRYCCGISQLQSKFIIFNESIGVCEYC